MRIRMLFLTMGVILALSPLSFPQIKAAAEKSTGTFIILKVDHVDSLTRAEDQRVIMERAIELLEESIGTLKLKAAELKQRAKDIIILSYQGNNDPQEVVQALKPKDLMVSFTLIGIFKGAEISKE